MRLFSQPDGKINNEERAAWVTAPFDLILGAPAPPKRKNLAFKRWLPNSSRRSPSPARWRAG